MRGEADDWGMMSMEEQESNEVATNAEWADAQHDLLKVVSPTASDRLLLPCLHAVFVSLHNAAWKLHELHLYWMKLYPKMCSPYATKNSGNFNPWEHKPRQMLV